MQARTDHTLSQQLSAAFDWWREAGVDCDFSDAAQAWLAEPETREPARLETPAPASEPAPPATPPIAGPADKWPQTLDEFARWWAAGEELALPGAGPIVLPRGVASPALMVLVPMPEATDRDTLLSAQEGALVTNMLAAMQIADTSAYIASALPRHTPLADWSALRAGGLADVLRHHIALVAPARLLVLGRDMLDLLGLDARQRVQQIECGNAAIQLLASYAPDALLKNAKLRADLWRRWLDWTGTSG